MTKRITSRELTEVRTVLSRANTALKAIEQAAYLRTHGDDFQREHFKTTHSHVEIVDMCVALQDVIDLLEDVERTTGYKPS